MLHGVSWVQFFSFLGIGLVIYYLVVGIQFLGKSVGGKASGQGTRGRLPDNGNGSVPVGVAERDRGNVAVERDNGRGLGPGSGSASAGPMERDKGGSEAPVAGVRTVMPETDGQPSLFGAERKDGDDAPELFKVMERVVGLLKEVESRGLAEHTRKEELVDHIRAVLAKFGQLKRTPYQVAINNYLVRTCSSQFSLVLDEEELERLWG